MVVVNWLTCLANLYARKRSLLARQTLMTTDCRLVIRPLGAIVG